MKGIVFYTVCGCLLVAGGISGSLDEQAKSHYVPVSGSRVYSESPEIPCYTEDEKVFYGLLPDTEERAGERVVSVGSTISNFNTVHLSDAAGRYKWTSEFAEWLELRRSIISNIGYVQMLPFNTQKITSVAWENSNQGNYNSCATFGFTNAYYATVNYNIALESGQYYKDFNPMFLYRNTSGGSGGRTLSEIVAFNVESGQASTDKVGRYPSLSGTDEFAKERRAVCIEIDNIEKMKLCLQAGIGVYVGNDVAVGANKQNTDGLRIAVLSGGWSHSTAFIGYVRENETDYYLWRNSHGARYSSGDKYNAPNDCCWMTEDMLNRFMNRMSGYGGAFAILPKSVKQ